MWKKFFQENRYFRSLKKIGLTEFFKFCTMLVYGVCNIMRRKKLGVTVLLLDLRSKIDRS